MSGAGASILASIPLHDTIGYVAAAYIVVFTLLLVYLLIIGRRVKRTERDLGELGELVRSGAEGGGEHRE